MKTQQLLELSALDALGLLEEHEREAFDRAFRAASPTLQSQIRREQARIANDDSLLPDVDAPIGLKAMVIARWREAVSARRRGLPPLLPSSGVSPLWRMGAVAAVAASIVLTVTTLQMQQNFKQFSNASEQIAWSKVLEDKFGENFRRAFFTYDHAQFVQVNDDFQGHAVLLVDSGRRAANSDASERIGELYIDNFPTSGGSFQIVLTDKDGAVVRQENKPVVLGGFRCTSETGPLLNVRITLTVEQLSDNYGLALVAPGESADNVVAQLAFRDRTPAPRQPLPRS